MATKIELPALKRRSEKLSYNNFNVAVYFPVWCMDDVSDEKSFEKDYARIFENVKVGRVYLENFRSMKSAPKETILKAKKFFEDRGIATSGGITTCASHNTGDGFLSLCYSDEESCKVLKESVIMNAEIFDEFIFDDFYFLNCRCPKCIEKKGNKTWSEFRIEQKKWVTKELVMEPAKKVNPNVNVIVKFPQWFEDFNETGYDLDIDTAAFDSIYTGTETRNPKFGVQHLPKYLGYITQRYYGSNAKGSNLGGWFDPYNCTYNLTSYLEQAYLTLYAKTKEATLFCADSLAKDPTFRLFPSVMGAGFEEMDDYLGKLGNPVGVMAYRPSYGRGENNIHSYLGMCGIPFEPVLDYPKGAKNIFLAESAADDKDVVAKMKESLLEGADVVVTSGFVRKLGPAFEEFAHLIVSNRKALVKDYAISINHGVDIEGKYTSERAIIIPQIDYCTNDVWEIAGAYGNENNFPVVLRWQYGNGNVSVITIPDDYSDLYAYPKEVLNIIRREFIKTTELSLIGPSKVMLFAYDNDTFIIDSNLEYKETVSVRLPKGAKSVESITYGREFTVEYLPDLNGEKNVPSLTMAVEPNVHYVCKIKY